MAEVADALLAGSGPSDDQVDKILREQITSPEARTKGYILDVDYS